MLPPYYFLCRMLSHHAADVTVLVIVLLAFLCNSPRFFELETVAFNKTLCGKNNNIAFLIGVWWGYYVCTFSSSLDLVFVKCLWSKFVDFLVFCGCVNKLKTSLEKKKTNMKIVLVLGEHFMYWFFPQDWLRLNLDLFLPSHFCIPLLPDNSTVVSYSIGPTPLRINPLYSSLSMLASTLFLNMAPLFALCFLNSR